MESPDKAGEEIENDGIIVTKEPAYKAKQFGSEINHVAFQKGDSEDFVIVERDPRFEVDEFVDEESFGQRAKNITDPAEIDDFAQELSN